MAISLALISLSSPALRISASAQLDAAFAAVENAKTVNDLLREARTASYNTPYVREGLWYAAALGTLPEDYARGGVPIKRVIKLAIYATLLELASTSELARWPEDEQFFAIGPASLNKMTKYIAFGREGDPLLNKGDAIHAWLKRGPSIDESAVDGNYRYLRLNLYSNGIYLLFEKTDSPVRGLSSRWATSQGPLDAEAKAKTIPAEGLTYVVPIASTGYIIAIAKAYLCLSLLPASSPLKKYALTIAGNSCYFLSRASGSDDSYQLADTASNILRTAVEGFRLQPNINGVLLTAETLQPRLTASRFFARKFKVALHDYEEAAAAQNRPVDFHVYGEWGAAMCLLGMKNTTMAARHLRQVVSLLKTDPPALGRSPYRYLIGALADADGAGVVFGGDASAESSSALDSWRKLQFNEEARYRLNLEFLHTLYTISDYDGAARFLMREIVRAHEQAAPMFRIVESDYLRELGSTLGDVFSELSWTMDEDGTVAPRMKDAQEWSHQFVSTNMDKYLGGCLGTNRYATCSPEEDRATVVAFYAPDLATGYGSVYAQLLQLSASHSIDLTTLTLSHEQPDGRVPAKDFGEWVQQEYSRRPPNLVPLLKLAWVEWFYLPMIGLDSPGPSVNGWRYHPLDKSGRTSVPAIEARLSTAIQGTEPQLRRTSRVFREAREFLSKYY